MGKRGVTDNLSYRAPYGQEKRGGGKNRTVVMPRPSPGLAKEQKEKREKGED